MKSNKLTALNLYNEYEILNLRITNLKWFIDVSLEFEDFSKNEKILMIKQYEAMSDYATILKNRAKIIARKKDKPTT